MEQVNQSVLLGMSGGTDSSVAAMLLQDAGYEVTGVTFRFYEKKAIPNTWMMRAIYAGDWESGIWYMMCVRNSANGLSVTL